MIKKDAVNKRHSKSVVLYGEMEYFTLEQFPLCIEYCKQWQLTKEDKEEWCSQKIELFRRIALLPTKSK